MHLVKTSVRNLVEFIFRNGDIISSQSGLSDPDAMQEGTRIHKKLQKLAGSSYRAEVPLSITVPVTRENTDLEITVEGRADGIFPEENGDMTIDEIKGIYRHPSLLTEPVIEHRAQALCYGYIYSVQNKCTDIGIRITYCHIPTEEVRYFTERIPLKKLEKWFLELLQEYAKWMVWQIKWQEERNASIRQVTFPFAYREGQHTLVKGVYQSILRGKRLYIEAPTGVGKTISTVFPAVKAIGEGITEKIFYLTAKTITRTVAAEAFQILSMQDMRLKYITLTAKEKICILPKPQCHPSACPRARGHFDRINDAVYDVLIHEDGISRETILSYAEKHQVCPFEMSLDISVWCDSIIGDYNYAFDPTACLKRFFSQETKNKYVYLIDEAHNLVDRAREMYSATLVKEDFLAAKKLTAARHKKLARGFAGCNKALLELKKEYKNSLTEGENNKNFSKEYMPKKYEAADIEPVVIKALRLQSYLEEFLLSSSHQQLMDPGSSSDDGQPLAAMSGEASPHKNQLSSEAGMEQILNLYFDLRYFLNIYESLNEKYTIYADFSYDGNFQLHLQCMDPSDMLDVYLNKGIAAIFFSATFLPIKYYREQLAGREDDYAIYAPSPFSPANRLLMIGRDVSTKYTKRSPEMYRRIADYIRLFVQARQGNYLVFFPSYKMLEDVAEHLLADESLYEAPIARNLSLKGSGTSKISSVQEEAGSEKVCVLMQNSSMTEQEREDFLAHFEENPINTTVGLCVMGGIFSEGIDLKDSRLIGAVIVGTGLPMVCTQNELFRDYFDRQKGTGFDYAYQYPGINKVLQAAGRVIRTDTDRGAILLLDERFLQQSYQALFPREWYPYEIVNCQSMEQKLKKFWE